MKTLYLTKYFPYITIVAVSIISTLILWLPFIQKNNFDTVIRHWDGPLYVIAAKTFYNVNDPVLSENVLGLPSTYFAAHLPGYPLTIRALQPIVGYLRATVLSTLLASVALFAFFYYMTNKLRLTSHPLILTLVFMFFTPRFFLVRSIGSPEPMFMLAVLASVYFFVRRKYLLAGLIGAIAIITKTPAILLCAAYCLFLAIRYIARKKISINHLWILLIPAGLVGVFTLYHYQYGDFFAYFNSGDNLHLSFPPFQTFDLTKNWIGTAWLEDIVYIYFLYGYTTLELLHRLGLYVYRSKNVFSSMIHSVKEKFHLVFGTRGYTQDQDRFYAVSACFAVIFYAAIICISHRDISRYSLPLLPFALITFQRFFTSRKFLILLLILIPAVYMYSWNLMLENVMPNINWGPFL